MSMVVLRLEKSLSSSLRRFEIFLDGGEALFDEDALAARGGGAGLGDEVVELVEIGLGEVASAGRVGVLDFNGDDAALFVVGDGGVAGQALGGIDAIALVVDVLEIEAVDEVRADGSTMQQAGEESGGGVAADQVSGKSAECAKASGAAAGESGQHHGACPLLLRRHDARGGFVALGDGEGEDERDDQRNHCNADEQAAPLPELIGARDPERGWNCRLWLCLARVVI